MVEEGEDTDIERGRASKQVLLTALVSARLRVFVVGRLVKWLDDVCHRFSAQHDNSISVSTQKSVGKCERVKDNLQHGPGFN